MGRAGRRLHIVVVGGGITGAFAAYFLARLGVGTTLVERGEIAGQASGNNSGGLNPLHGPGIPGPMLELARQSFRLHLETWDPVRRLSGIDFAPRRAARVQLAMDELDLEHLEQSKKLHDSTPGFSAGWVDREELLAREPRLNPSFRVGLQTEGNGKVDSGSYARAVVLSAAKLGATTVRGEVRGLKRRGDRVTGVVLDSGALNCDGVVVASGPWCAEPSGWLDMTIPVEPVKGELLLVKGGGGTLPIDLGWRDTAAYATAGEEIWVGGTEDRVGFDPVPSPAARASILEQVAQLLPGMSSIHVLEQTAGLRPVTPDGFPIVGIPAGWENVGLALGGGRKGVLLSAGLGCAAAELVVLGTTTLAIGACAPERWAAASR